jgi:hypothetical protein
MSMDVESGRVVTKPVRLQAWPESWLENLVCFATHFYSVMTLARLPGWKANNIPCEGFNSLY